MIDDSILIQWFPQEYAPQFYYVKGVVGVFATVALLFYMNRSWSNFKSFGQRMRFFSLLYFSALITAASAEQIKEGVDVSLRNIGGMAGVFLLIFTVYVSVREDVLNKSINPRRQGKE